MQAMWMRLLGSNKRAVWVAGAAILTCLALLGLAFGSNSPEKAAGDSKVTAPPSGPARGHEISFMGKFSCPLKRQVILPYGGIITSLQAEAGQ